MICPDCGGKGGDTYDVFGWVKCRTCNGTGEVEQTNDEWLRTLPADEQVKEVLSHGFMTEKRTAEEFVKWLEEKHE